MTILKTNLLASKTLSTLSVIDSCASGYQDGKGELHSDSHSKYLRRYRHRWFYRPHVRAFDLPFFPKREASSTSGKYTPYCGSVVRLNDHIRVQPQMSTHEIQDQSRPVYWSKSHHPNSQPRSRTKLARSKGSASVQHDMLPRHVCAGGGAEEEREAAHVACIADAAHRLTQRHRILSVF